MNNAQANQTQASAIYVWNNGHDDNGYYSVVNQDWCLEPVRKAIRDTPDDWGRAYYYCVKLENGDFYPLPLVYGTDLERRVSAAVVGKEVPSDAELTRLREAVEAHPKSFNI